MGNLSFSIWVTHDCNLNCNYCYEKEKVNSHMTIQTAEQTIRFIQEVLNVKKPDLCLVHFHGGEPLLNSEIIWFIIENLKYRRINYSLTTNGTIMDEKIESKLVKYIHDISFSIDGNESSHNQHRKFIDGSGTFESTQRNFLVLLRVRKDISVRMTITPNTVKEVYSNIQYFIQLGVKTIIPVIDLYDTNWTDKKLQQYLNILKNIKDYLHSNKIADVKITMINDNSLMIKKQDCDGGINSFSIDALGRIFPCTAVMGMESFQCGTIYSGINEEWELALSKIVKMENEECVGCTYKMYCVSSRCKFVNHALTGYYNHVSRNICANENIKYELFLYNTQIVKKI